MKILNQQYGVRWLAVAVLLSGAGPVNAADSFSQMFTQGQGGMAFRYRLESVDQDAFAEKALASTLRTRLNFRTADWRNFGAFVEFDYVASLVADDYNAGSGNSPDRLQYPVVADPTGPDLNQAWLQWQNADGMLLRAGRQRLIFDNARFVGNVGWRQNEQTYDAALAEKKTASGFDLQLAHVWAVKRIFGRDVAAGSQDNRTWLANLSRNFRKTFKLTAYVYDIDNRDLAAFSTLTWGARFTRSHNAGKSGLDYALEYAHQTGAHRNPAEYTASYYRVDVSVKLRRVTPYAGFESLGGDDGLAGAAFRTPLATLHAFDGWADMFLSTPDAGLQDLFGGFRGAFAAWSWDMLYHHFQAESGDRQFGDEWDAALSRGFAENYNLLLKAAVFDGKDGSVYPDTTKLWLQLSASF